MIKIHNLFKKKEEEKKVDLIKLENYNITINDSNGYYIGKTINNKDVILNQWLREGSRYNSNWLLTGIPGIGKTAFVKYCLKKEYKAGTKIIVLDPESEYSDIALNESIKGDVFKCDSKTAINFKMDKNFIVFDTSKLFEEAEKIKKEYYYNLVSMIWEHITKDKTEQVVFCIDCEFTINDFPELMELLETISNRSRVNECALWVVTHSALDLLESPIKKYGQSIIDHASYKFIMGTYSKNLEEIKNLFNLTEREEYLLSSRNRGRGLLMAGNIRLEVDIKVENMYREIYDAAGGR